MIDCIFTLDYEIYGDGSGSLKELVYDPTEKLRQIFRKWDARFVNFVEVAEFEKIESSRSDPAIELVKLQIREMYDEDFEIALHLHPQWCNARFEQGRWLLDAAEYNLCPLSEARIAEIVDRSLEYLGRTLHRPGFAPLSFRAGNWLFQPTKTAAGVLSRHGIKIDSSVFKGGLQHLHRLDYRPALKNGYYWRFADDVNRPSANGPWIEVPIYTEMARPWKMATAKRMSLKSGGGMSGGKAKGKWNRARDLLRLRYPLKFDFTRMTLDELTSMVDRVAQEDQAAPAVYRPLVAIGHSKDLDDPGTIDAFLSFLRAKGIRVATFQDIYPKLAASEPCSNPRNQFDSLPEGVHPAA